MSDLEAKSLALAKLDERLAAGEISGDEYERLRALLTSGLTPEQCAQLGVTATPAPAHISGVTFGPSGGQTRMPTIAELELEPGTVLLDQWKIIRELGRGGFGVVFEAEDIKLDRTVAVKVLDPAMAARADLLARFRREVTLMRELAHERIVRVYDYREEARENLALITMEYVSGCSVHAVLELARASQEKLGIELAGEIFRQTLEALAAAHSRGVIHRDVTPGNILLAGGTAAELMAHPGKDPQVKLVDFGIAGLAERTELSAKSRVLGTAAYVAPEVLDPDAEITPEVDVYGAGAVVYELLTGKTPMVTGYRPVVELRVSVLPSLAEVVIAAVRPIPGERPTPAQGIRALENCREQQQEAARKRKEIKELQAQVSFSVQNNDEADLRNACRALREILGSEAESDERLRSGERCLALREEERREKEDSERREKLAAGQRERHELQRGQREEAAEQRKRQSRQLEQGREAPQTSRRTVPLKAVVGLIAAVGMVVVGVVVTREGDQTGPETQMPRVTEDRGRPSIPGETAAKIDEPHESAIVIDQLSRSDVDSFVETFISATSSGDAHQVVSLYADKVDYFGAGVVGTDFILTDKGRYFQRWPEVRYRLLGSIDFDPSADPAVGTIGFDIEYRVFSQARSSEKTGRARNTLKVRKEDNRIVIIDEKQKVLRNG